MKGKFVGTVVVIAILSLSAVAFASGVQVGVYSAGQSAVGLFTNTTGAKVVGVHVEFDQAVTITNKVEIGGYLPAPSKLTGTAFDFAGGSLVNSGTVELDWQPATAKPALVQWIGESGPVGTPYFTTLSALGKLLGEGIVRLRQEHPDVLQQAFAQFFADNAEFFASLSQSLGVSLKDSLMPIIMSAPAEGIENFFNTLVGTLGVKSLDDLLHSNVNFTALFHALGL